MENPLREHCLLEVKIFVIEFNEPPICIQIYSDSYDKLAWKIKESIEEYPQHFCLLICGKKLLTDEEIEQINAIGKQYYEEHKKEIDGG
jgi:uncharacterized protein YlzI (FlbEa/FlbD family)